MEGLRELDYYYSRYSDFGQRHAKAAAPNHPCSSKTFGSGGGEHHNYRPGPDLSPPVIYLPAYVFVVDYLNLVPRR